MLTVALKSCLTAALVVGVLAASPSPAADRAAELLPPSTIVYVAVADPPAALAAASEHPVAAHLRSTAAFRRALDEPKTRQFLTAVKYVESQLGMSWRDAFTAAMQGGLVLAFDARTEAAAVLMQASDEGKLQRIMETFVELALDDARRKGEEPPFEQQDYRGITIYRTKQGGFAARGRWLVLVNKTELGREILDALLDSRARSLADVPSFQEAERRGAPDQLAWAYVNVAPVREAGAAPRLFSGRADDPAGELLLGGVLEVLRHTPSLTAALRGDDERLAMTVSMPLDRSWLSGEREHYFGAQGRGAAPAVCDVPQTLFSLVAYRDLSQLWLRSGELFDEQVNDRLAEADGKLSTLFAGKDFGEDILGSIQPGLQVIAVRQEFPPDRPAPAIRLPALALVAELKDREATGRELRRIFQSLIGFLNVVGAMNGHPQLDLNMEPLPDGELVSATFVDDAAEAAGSASRIHGNFSPSIAFSGARMIISSTAELARQLATSSTAAPHSGEEIVNLRAVVSAKILRTVLVDNRSHLISQNMLEKGHSRDEAALEIETLLDLLSLMQDAALTLSTSDDSLDVNFEVRLTRPASAP